MLVGGFLVDFVAFVNIDIIFKFSVLIFYWLLAGFAIAFMQLYDAGKVQRSRNFDYARLFMPLVIQFTFGGLLNISLIFYWFSGAFSVSWPILVIMVLLLLFNDAFRHQFSNPLIQIPVYYFVTFSLFSLVLPFIFASLNAWLFVVAGISSFVLMVVYIYYISFKAGYSKVQKGRLMASIVSIVIVMNALYFANILPPIPLALREAELYHSLKVSGSQYIMTAEPETFFQGLQDVIFGQTVHVVPGEKIYLYTSIFAPARLKTTITDHWEYYDEVQKEWVDQGDFTKSTIVKSVGRKGKERILGIVSDNENMS
jgi:hypothetical protein